ncbi:MAG: NADH:flavin oxidoreductase, partial [Polyangiaceae bacterium]|nr:NADH:flavin oxidoreductase [Polyangiaceae bacterium]
MWRPPERIRHPLPVARAPRAEEAQASLLFTALTLPSGLELAERTWVPAMVPWRASARGEVTPEVLAWYARFAAGQPGALVVEATGVRDVPSGPLLRIHDDGFVPGLRELVRTVREASGGRTRLFLQLIDFLRIRRRPVRERFFAEFLAVTAAHRSGLVAATGQAAWLSAPEPELRRALAALPDAALGALLAPRELEALRFGARERVWDEHEPSVASLPRVLPGAFARAARRAREAGFDGVELHYAHAYTMASFLSALNVRRDGYGGDLAGRVRLPLEVAAAVRDAVGARYTVGCRMLCHEAIAGGTSVEDAAFFATNFARAGLDFVSLSTGGKFEDAAQPRVGEAAYPYTGPSGYACMPTVRSDARGPFGRNVPEQARVRAAVRAAGLEVPFVVCGGIHHFDQAEDILARGDGDLVAAARQSLADPDWFRKLRLGRGAEVRRCAYTNYCEALDQRHAVVTCRLWDR